MLYLDVFPLLLKLPGLCLIPDVITMFKQRLNLDERMYHEIKWSTLLSLRVQICLLSSVAFLCFMCQKDAVGFLYLVLKLFSVSPMYVSEGLLSLRVTVAWDITDVY